MITTSPFSFVRAAVVTASCLLPVFVSAAPPVAGPNVNMVSGTRFPEGDPFLTKQNEPSIAVSSRNPRHLLAASNDYRQVAVLTAEGLKGGKAWNTLYKSVDGGTSWRSVVLGGCPLDIPACNDATGLTAPLKALAPDFSADPTLRSGPHGTFFYSFIAGRRDGSTDGVVAIQRFVDKNNNIQRDTDVRKIGNDNVIKWAEDPILPDKLNIIDRGTSGQFIDKPWNAADVGGRAWNAGKTCDLLSWTNASGIVTSAVETVPAFNVYVSYAIFAGSGNNEHPKVYVAASQDCGNTFGKPNLVSNSLDANSGTSMVIDPLTGTVYVVWRRFGSLESPPKPDQIYINKSTDGGKTWLNQPVVVTDFIPYDQAATGGSFRTLAFPSVAVSVDGTGKSRVHVAFTARGARVDALPPYACQASDPKQCDARIKIATSKDGALTWLPPADVDPILAVPTNPAGRGHQVQPAMTFAAGKLFVTWLDQRFDQTEEVLTCPGSGPCTAGNLVRSRVPMGNLDPNCAVDVSAAPLSTLPQQLKDLLGPAAGACHEYRTGRPSSVWTTYLTDGSPGLVRRHTIDVFAAMATPSDAPVFAGNSNRVSQYQFGSSSADAEGKYAIRQKEVFAPNLPLFVNGGAAFVGDYIDAAGQNIVATSESDPALPGKYRYKFNVGVTSCATAACAQYTTGGLSPVFHVAHTDNRNVIPPANGDWTTPTCLATALNGTGSTNFSNSCWTRDASGNLVQTGTPSGYAGNRNQDVFSTIVTESSVAYANANSKALGSKPRGFVVTVDNFSDTVERQYEFSLAAPSGVEASFDKRSFDPPGTIPTPPGQLTSVPVLVQPRSSATRSVWVKASASNAPIVVNITSPSVAVPASGSNPAYDLPAYSAQVALNPDPGATASLVGSGDGAGIDDVANNDLGNVVLSNAALTNNVLSNNALTNAALTNNALTNAALTNVVLSNVVQPNLQVENLNPVNSPLETNVLSNAVLTNAVLSNVVLTNAVLTNVVLTNAALSNNALTNAVLTNNVLTNTVYENVVLSNNALTNVALTNIDPANVALSNAVLTNNVLTNVALSNNALTNVMLTNAALTNAALTNVVLSNNALSNNALSNNALSNNALSNNALSNSPLSDDLRTVEAANFDLGKNSFTSDDLAVSDFLDASFTVRNRGNTDTTLAVKLLLRDATCTGGNCSLPPGVKLQLVMRKITLTPTAIPPTGPAASTGRALRLGLVQSNAQVSNVGTPEIVDPEASDLGRFLPGKPDAATLPLSPGERAYVTLRAIGATDFNLVEFLRWGVKMVVVDAANETRTLIPLIIKTLTLPSVTATQPASLALRTAGGFGSVTGTAVCADQFGTPFGQPGFVAGTPCLPPATATFANDGSGNGTLAFTPAVAGEFYVLLTVTDGSVPQQDDQQLLKVTVNRATLSSIFGFPPTSPVLPSTLAYGQTLQLPALVSPGAGAPTPTYSTNDASVCYVDAQDVLQTVGPGNCIIAANSAETTVYAALTITADPITIGKAATTTTVTVADATYDGSAHGGTASVTGPAGLSQSLTVTYTGTVVGGAAYGPNTTPPKDAGSYTASASYVATTNYLGSSDSKTFSIGQAATTTTVTASNATYDGSTHGGTASVTGPAGLSQTLTVTYTGTVVGGAAYGPSTTAPKDAGSYTALASYAPAANANYLGSSDSKTFSIARVASTTTVTASSATYDGSTHGGTASVTGAGGLNQSLTVITYTGTVVGGAAYGPSTTAPKDAGSYTAAASYVPAANANYLGSSDSKPFSIGLATLIVTASVSPSTLTYGDPDPTYSPSYADTANCVTGALTVAYLNKPSTTPAPFGTYTITPSITAGVSSSCTIEARSTTLTVNKATPVFSAIVSSFVYPAGTGATLSGKLARATATGWVIPPNALSIALQGTANTRSYSVFAGGTDGQFSQADSTIPPDSYTVTFTYGGGTNFNAASNSPYTSTLRIEGFSGTGAMLQARSYHTATLLNDGRVLVAGGFDAFGSATATSEVYCAVTSAVCPTAKVGTFTSVGNLPSKSAAHGATLLNDGRVLATGGGNSSAETFSASPAPGSWTSAGGMSSVRSYHTATRLPDGRVLLVGGADNASKTLQSTIIFNPSNGSFTSGPTMTAARERHAAILLTSGPNAGKVLVVGGRQKSGSSYVVLRSAELCNATSCTGNFATSPTVVALPLMGTARFAQAITMSADNKVVVTGGSGDTSSSTATSALNTAEAYDPASNTAWAAVSMTSSRRDHTLTQLFDGRLLATGGLGGSPFAAVTSSELFTTGATPLFTTGATMTAARYGHRATRLPDGRVLVTGGTGSSGIAIPTAELYSGPAYTGPGTPPVEP